MAILYDQMGNVIGDFPDDVPASPKTAQGSAIPPNDAAIPTMDPNFVKVKVPADGTPPGDAVAYAKQPDGSLWAYIPTEQARRMGKIMAAVDTVVALPGQIADTAQNFIETTPTLMRWIIIGIVGVAAIELLNRLPKGKR